MGVEALDIRITQGTKMEGVEPNALSALAELDSDLDSEDLDKIEDEAEKEMIEEFQRQGTMEAVSLTADASSSSEHSEVDFGPLPREEIQELLLDLEQLGLAGCLQKVVSTDAEKVYCAADTDCSYIAFAWRNAGKSHWNS